MLYIHVFIQIYKPIHNNKNKIYNIIISSWIFITYTAIPLAEDKFLHATLFLKHSN